MGMKRRCLCLTVLLGLLAAGCFSDGPGWRFRRSLPVGATSHGHRTVSAPGHPVRYGKHSERFEVRPGDCSSSNRGWNDCDNDRERSELRQVSPAQYEGDEYWYRWSILLPQGHTNLYPVKSAYGQFHQKGCKVAFMFQEHAGGYHLNVQPVIAGSDRRYPLLSASEFVGKWNDIVVHARWTKGEDGRFEVWANGDRKAVYEGPTMTCDEVYFKYGMYRSFVSRNAEAAGRETTVVYFDGVVRSRSGAGMFDPLPE